MVFDLFAAELRVVRIVDLFAHMELDQQRLYEVILAVCKPFHVECPHCLDGSLGARRKNAFIA